MVVKNYLSQLFSEFHYTDLEPIILCNPSYCDLQGLHIFNRHTILYLYISLINIEIYESDIYDFSD